MTSAVIVFKDDGPWLQMSCPKKTYCEVPVTKGPPIDGGPRGREWHWDGNVDAPTIKPSIGCDHSPRCGQHRVIENGGWDVNSRSADWGQRHLLAAAEAPNKD